MLLLFLGPTQRTQADSWAVVRSATTGSSPQFGSWGLRPTSKALSRESTFTHTFDVEPVGATTIATYQTKIEWFGTARLRVGYVWGNGVLTYVTGGLAYGKVDLEGTSAINGHVGGSPFFVSHAIGHSNINTGWTVGYGTEGPIDFWGLRNWTWKIESLYMDFGHLDAADASGLINTHTHFTDWILRGGLNYRFY